jgi:repressor LexA
VPTAFGKGAEQVPEYAVPQRFTRKQGQYLAFIHLYTKLNGVPPAEADIQRYFEVTPPSVHDMVLRLENRCLITRVPGQPRSIRVLIPPEQIPALD